MAMMYGTFRSLATRLSPGWSSFNPSRAGVAIAQNPRRVLRYAHIPESPLQTVADPVQLLFRASDIANDLLVEEDTTVEVLKEPLALVRRQGPRPDY